jgi:hypothetical protein
MSAVALPDTLLQARMRRVLQDNLEVSEKPQPALDYLQSYHRIQDSPHFLLLTG